ncbi:hypothetical protein D3C78_1987640 [compost metagenome]
MDSLGPLNKLMKRFMQLAFAYRLQQILLNPIAHGRLCISKIVISRDDHRLNRRIHLGNFLA